MLDYSLYMDMLRCESTSGTERALAEMLMTRLKREDNTITPMEVGDGTLNLLIEWGTARTLLCTHLDTVPPYIPPHEDGDTFFGRGTCDAKGQIASMWAACCALADKGVKDFGLLLLSGEETGSFGAKAFRTCGREFDCVIVGEPTDNKLVAASKGTKSFALTFQGRSCHSGYPKQGESAVMNMLHFLTELEDYPLPYDEQLGSTTWNVGKLQSDNAQNVLSDSCSLLLYFRTTPLSDTLVTEVVKEFAERFRATVVERGGDTPMEYRIIPGMQTTVVSFGSDAPQLTNCRERMLYGAGSILCAHRDNEHVSRQELEQAAADYVKLVKNIMKI